MYTKYVCCRDGTEYITWNLQIMCSKYFFPPRLLLPFILLSGPKMSPTISFNLSSDCACCIQQGTACAITIWDLFEKDIFPHRKWWSWRGQKSLNTTYWISFWLRPRRPSIKKRLSSVSKCSARPFTKQCTIVLHYLWSIICFKHISV